MYNHALGVVAFLATVRWLYKRYERNRRVQWGPFFHERYKDDLHFYKDV